MTAVINIMCINTFIVTLHIGKKKMQYIVLIVHCFHPLISEEQWGRLLILDIKVGITFTRNKHYILVINITMMLQIITKFEEQTNTIPHQTNDIFKERQKTFPRIVQALARILHEIGKQGIAYQGAEEKADDDKTSGNP